MPPAGLALNHLSGQVVLQKAIQLLCETAKSALIHVPGFSRIRAIKAHSRNRRHAVLRVPPEIWDMIAAYLPALSATCLALSCRSFYYHLGRQHWLQPKHNERIAFLALVDPKNLYVLLNFPEHYYRDVPWHPNRWKISMESHCQASAQFKGKGEMPFELWPSTKHKSYLPEIKNNSFPFWQIQLIMNLYRNTSDGYLSLEAIDHTWTSGRWKFHTCAFVDREKLILKMEMLQIVDPAVDHDYLDTLRCGEGEDLTHLDDLLCVRGDSLRILHSKRTPGSTFINLQSIVRSVFLEYWSEGDSVASSSCGDCQFCPTCYTAYQVKIESCPPGPKEQCSRTTPRGRTPFTIRVTRLSDLGEGKTRKSLQWQTTIDSSYVVRRLWVPPFDPWPEHCDTEADILQAFAERERREIAHYAKFPPRDFGSGPST